MTFLQVLPVILLGLAQIAAGFAILNLQTRVEKLERRK